MFVFSCVLEKTFSHGPLKLSIIQSISVIKITAGSEFVQEKSGIWYKKLKVKICKPINKC